MQVSPRDIPALLARERDRLRPTAARDVDDVELAAGDARKLDRPVRRLAFRLRRPRQRVEARAGVARGQSLLHQHVDRVAVLGMHHQRARLGGDLHDAEERLVVDHQRALVGHEELVARDPLVGQRRELLERAALLQVGDRHVVAHVDHLLAVRFAFHSSKARRTTVPCGWMMKSTMRRRSAERRGGLARRDVVDRDRAAERHVEMRVRVDAAGQDVAARSRRSPCPPCWSSNSPISVTVSSST